MSRAFFINTNLYRGMWKFYIIALPVSFVLGVFIAHIIHVLLYRYLTKEIMKMAHKTWKKGDTVFATDVFGKVIEAKIKSVHKKQALPVELDLDHPMRFYLPNELFATREEAVSANMRATRKQFHDAQEAGQSFSGDQDTAYDANTHTFIKANGERVSEFYKITKKQEAEYNKMLSQLIDFCEEHALPFFAMLGTYNKKNGSWGVCHSLMLPGPRTPPIFDAIEGVFHMFTDDGQES